jgi:hypothetical protein
MSWPGYPAVESLPSCSVVEPGVKVRFIVQLTRDSYLLPGLDPCGRTTVESSAKRYRTCDRANLELAEARKYRPFAEARILCLRVKPA